MKKLIIMLLVVYCISCENGSISENIVRSIRPDEKANNDMIEYIKSINNNLSGNYTLQNDVDLSDIKWTPIGFTGNICQEFNGIFDGNGYNISGLFLSKNKSYPALFCKIGENAQIKNLTINIGSTDVIFQYTEEILMDAVSKQRSNQAKFTNILLKPIPRAKTLTNEHAHVGHIGGNVPPTMWQKIE